VAREDPRRREAVVDPITVPMTAPHDRLPQAAAIVGEALRVPPPERTRFVAAACADDESLRLEVERMLSARADAGTRREVLPGESEDAGNLPRLEGRTIGPYKIVRSVGAGGMGEVYEARDQRLNRTVAIKVLPRSLAKDREAAERFAREARAIAALNHPNICTLHDVGDDDGVAFLVMEYLEGESLSSRLTRGPLKVEQALRYAIQIASALDRVHRAGLVHRDLKPGNIMLTKGAADSRSSHLRSSDPTHATLVDFGISKARGDVAAVPGDETTMSPVSNLTQAGTLLGTVRYMAPEQLNGRSADARADIFSFGAVLYEMVVGRPAFDAPATAGLLLAIREQEPAPSARLSAPLDRVVHTCLTKDPDDRWQTARDLLRELQWIEEGLHLSDAATPQSSRHVDRRWMVAALAFAALAAISAAVYFASSRATPAVVVARFELSTPSTNDPTSFALSADGRQLVFVANDEGVAKLWVRPLDQVSAKALDGTDGASFPFWSPDGSALGFFAEGKLKRIDVGGAHLQILADAASGRGGAWNRDGTILFAPTTASVLLQVPAGGGTVQPATRFSTGQNSHRWPQFLPNGRTFVYLSTQGQPGTQGVFVATIGSGDATRVLEDDAAPSMAGADRLLVVREGALASFEFDGDGRRVKDEPTVVVRPVGFDSQLIRGAVATSETGVLVHRATMASPRQLTWYDRAGQILGTVGPPDHAAVAAPELSSDGRRVAVFRSLDGNADVWEMTLEGGVPSRLTFAPGLDGFPLWQRDGNGLLFTTLRTRYDLLERTRAGVERALFANSGLRIPTGLSPDGRYLLYAAQVPATGVDLWATPMPPGNDRPPFAVAHMPFDEMAGQFSSSGDWIAYQSNATGVLEVYVQPFPDPGTPRQVSLGGGTQPRWSPDGRELFYVAPDGRLMSVAVRPTPTAHALDTEAPKEMFRTRLATGANIPPAVASKPQYAVAADGRFLMNVAIEGTEGPPLTVSIGAVR
jgi:eukaryotic-like serine/threonine-protein kinase